MKKMNIPIISLTKQNRQGIISNQITDTLREGYRLKEKIASLILKYNEQWEQADKSVIADNLEECICERYPSCADMFDRRWKKLVEISGAKEQTVYAWLNRSRKNVKIPFLTLCRVAVALDSDIAELLKAHD